MSYLALGIQNIVAGLNPEFLVVAETVCRAWSLVATHRTRSTKIFVDIYEKLRLLCRTDSVSLDSAVMMTQTGLGREARIPRCGLLTIDRAAPLRGGEMHGAALRGGPRVPARSCEKVLGNQMEGKVSKANLRRPTDAELAILRVLWRLGPSTVRQVQEELNRNQPTGYTTVLKMLQIMTEKGLVGRDESERTHVYEATLPEEETQKQLVSDLLERAFGGSARRLVLHALSVKQTSKKELARIRRLLDELEGGSK